MAVADRTIRDTKPHGWLSLADIIAVSSNIGAAKVGQALGRERLARSLKALGFGEKSGIPFPGESAGTLRPPESWSTVSTATVSFGHGLAVNAMQMAAAYRVLASGGRFMVPQIVLSIDRPDGRRDRPAARSERQVMRPETTRLVTAMLEKAVGTDGTGMLARVGGYRVAGKTGTAQKADPVTGGYSNDRYVAVFAGYLPADAPRVVIVVAVDEPVDVHTGGAVAAPVFAEIGDATMRYLGVVPSEAVAAAGSAPPSPTPPPLAADELEGTLVVESGTPAAAGGKSGGLPSFVGLTAREALAAFVEVGGDMDVEMEGSGRVTEQDPPAGSGRSGVRRLRLVLSRQ